MKRNKGAAAAGILMVLLAAATALGFGKVGEIRKHCRENHVEKQAVEESAAAVETE